MPKQGPSDGSRRHTVALAPILLSASFKPMLVVVLPSPAGVGDTAVTRTSLPDLAAESPVRWSSDTLAL